MKNTIRTTYYLKHNNLCHKSQYEKQIYIKNSRWHPPPAPLQIEEKISSFEMALKEKHNILINNSKQHNLLNLTPIQKKVMDQLKQNKNIIIKPMDKNFGPAITDTSDYIWASLNKGLQTTYTVQSYAQNGRYKEST